MKTIQLPQSQLEIVKAIIDKIVPHYKIKLFGSRVKHSASQFSDLDVAIITPDSLSVADYTALTEAFSNSRLPIKVDIVDYQMAKPAFKAIIDADYVYLQDAVGLSD